jgi:hypothetical protein
VSEEKKIMPKAKVRKEEITSLERQALEGLSDVEKTNIGKQILFKKVYSPDYRMMGIGIAIGAPVGAVVSLIICWYIWGLPLFLRLFT